MVVVQPKGYKYWYWDENDKQQIRDDAPDWAKEEFENYLSTFNGDSEGDIHIQY